MYFCTKKYICTEIFNSINFIISVMAFIILKMRVAYGRLLEYNEYVHFKRLLVQAYIRLYKFYLTNSKTID